MTYGYIVVWIILSATVILFNKYILAYTPFKYPGRQYLCMRFFVFLLFPFSSSLPPLDNTYTSLSTTKPITKPIKQWL